MKMHKKAAWIVVYGACVVLLLETACQAFFFIVVARQLESQRNDPLHYYRASADPVLAYELKPGFRIEKDERRIEINGAGLRNDEDGADGRRKVALLGDSVVFGVGMSQEETPAARLQQLAGGGFKVLNFGVPGYGLEEILRSFENKLAVHSPQSVALVLNLNDFSRRNTVYEGADNGLYRMYVRPCLKMPFFIRKAVYRHMKDGKMSSPRWYRWLYEGNKKRLLPAIGRISELCADNNCELAVILFPPAVAYEDGQFVLQDIFDDVVERCGDYGIPVIVPVAEFSRDVYDLQDHTDHLTSRGCELMADVISGWLLRCK